VLFGLTVYYWIVFFRNPFRWLYFFSHPQSDMGEENRVGEGEVGVFSGSVHGKNLEVLAEENTSSAHTSMRTGKYSEQYDIPVHVDVDGDGVVDVTLPPTQVIEDAGVVFSDHSSWWLFAATNYDSFGYNGWFGSMILLIIVAIVAIVV
jgi:hypothetical protein